MAGKSSTCVGCPNQAACASGQSSAPDPAIEEIKARMSLVKHKILVLSGKGGVGKSTVASQVAMALSGGGNVTGLLDIDVCGPSAPRMLGVEDMDVHQSGSGWQPVWVDENLCVMSIGFMLPSRDDAVVWRGVRKIGLIKQFLKDVNWEKLDYLVIDAPPGTSDEHITIAQCLNQTSNVGAVIVTTPQEVALLDVRKEINFCRKAGVKILGVIENMAGFVCPHCGNSSEIFVPSEADSVQGPSAVLRGAEAMAKKHGIPFLGRIPLDPKLGIASERGEALKNSLALQSLQSAVQNLRINCKGNT
ncbi:hypothetical protein GUITHDRAFT_109471 [Guillardia theta CCMP2712]|uniref:Cytosolic Fe-S cluster assembly factor NUBP1 homolog n=1 Tax=Guillardia theta (strain CCMP2712) TaxID=905079 RepID=L1J834_GUITC|nr:hypothetical protein GUITHDRAFT_109471 [Guillardia theta CCMP2712]EKX44691.1 hypothetical protein GUITHDRAFT_109471 [Guillardia theta CCMP2712]|eukprot:XP_005831671.1 hypothetical protein GUITHDRAFT_109471 [Guillardia theta CCMP2712]